MGDGVGDVALFIFKSFDFKQRLKTRLLICEECRKRLPLAPYVELPGQTYIIGSELNKN